MAGRPSLRIGQHGKITRKYLGGGIWLAQCRFRDTDGVTRRVQRLGPPDEHDKYGKLADDALIESLVDRRPPSGADRSASNTLVMTLVDQHIERLTEDGRVAPHARHLPLHRDEAVQVHGRREGGGGVGRPAGCGPAVDARLLTGPPWLASPDPAARSPPARRPQQRPRRQPGARCPIDQVQGTAQGCARRSLRTNCAIC